MYANLRPTLKILIAAMALAASAAQAASSVTVNDDGDGDIADSLCTLREAITAADSQTSYHGCTFSGNGAPTTIAFNIAGSGVHTINVGSRLPVITVPVVLDGLSQPGAACTSWPPTLLIEISNPSDGQYNGLSLNNGSGGSSIRGLVINGFNNNTGVNYNFNAAINIYNSDGNYVECNFLGTDASGTTNKANLRGVDINSASNNVVGSDGAAKAYFSRNLISGNRFGQVDTRGNALSGNRISGNFIGTEATGTQAMSGQAGGGGVDISANPGPASGNFVGWDGVGDPTLMRNIIAGFTGNSYAGVTMVVGASGNHVSGNYIGTDVTGSVAIPNFFGVALGSNNTVHDNIIGNDGTQDASSARNVISGNSFAGVDVNAANGTRDNAVIGNYIGMNAAGTATLGNGNYGISMDYATADTLVARNWIAGQGTAIRFFASGGFGGGSTASFINNADGSNANLPAVDSSDNCVLGTTGVLVYAPGANVSNPNVFAGNWWGASTGPNTTGASSADGSIGATPYLTQPATVCSDVIFRNGFEAP
jgi:CSLREA domain-containing protein